jgi:hypothetical protein
MTDLPLPGGCNCGAVRFEVTAPLVIASYCHCRRCQRRTGAAASANAHPAPHTFRIVDGENRLVMWKPDDGGEKWFCRHCGSSVFGRNPNHADSIGIRMGAFDGDPGIRASVRQFVAYAAPWEPIPDDGLPRYPESRHQKGGPQARGASGQVRPAFAPQSRLRGVHHQVPAMRGKQVGRWLAKSAATVAFVATCETLGPERGQTCSGVGRVGEPTR